MEGNKSSKLEFQVHMMQWTRHAVKKAQSAHLPICKHDPIAAVETGTEQPKERP
jgi:hypothetical protein